MGLVSEVVSELVPADWLRERAMWIAKAIAASPALAVQGTVRAIWMAHEAGRRQALEQLSSLVSLGTAHDNIADGQQSFKNGRVEWQLR